MKRAGKLWMLGVAALALLTVAGAERTRYWRQSSYDDFEKGKAKGVALRSDGRLVLAPRFAQISDPNAAQLLDAVLDSKGQLFAAAGTNAKVFRFDEKGTATTVFESQELAAQTLALDARDNLYIGTSPDGKVYRLTPRGERSVFFEPKTKYIWDVVVDASGTVFVATGDKGEIFAVAPDGKGELFFRSEETHARSLALDSKGHLIVGTEPSGLILRIERGPAGASGAGPTAAKPEARRAFVLYETDRKEVTALLLDSAGQIYAASIGDKPRAPAIPMPTPPIVPQTAVTASGPGSSVATAVPVGQQQPRFIPFPALAGGSGVYRLAADGSPEELWTSREDLVYSLGFSAEGKLLVGTGNKGLIVQLESRNRLFTRLPKTAAEQVTAFAAAPGGKLYVATANPGKVFTLGPELEPEGTFESQTFDAKNFSQWGRLTWWGEDDANDGSLAFYVRSGNTSNPEKNWSEWAGPLTNPDGAAPACPPARFVQWKAVLKAQPAAAGAPANKRREAGVNISWVSLAYLPKNVAPTVDAIVVQNPGIRVQGFPAPPQPQPMAQLRLPPAQIQIPGVPSFPQQQQQQQPPGQAPRFEPPPQGFAQRGYQSVIWSARDENDDELEYAIYFRGEGEKNWKLLKDKLSQRFYAWESGTMPDGAYYLKIVASDAPANPPDEALTGERISDRFEIDNTPPAVEGLAAQAASPEVRIRFTARDSYSAMGRVEYSLNAGEWQLVLPVDRVTDSREEKYEMVLKDLAPGEYTLAVRAFDQFENSSSAKVSFTVEAPRRR
jgi:sugar lactone lactonase YvrE